MTNLDLRQQISAAIEHYCDNTEKPDSLKCAEVTSEAMLLAAFSHVASGGSDISFLRMALRALEGAQMASPKQ